MYFKHSFKTKTGQKVCFPHSTPPKWVNPLPRWCVLDWAELTCLNCFLSFIWQMKSCCRYLYEALGLWSGSRLLKKVFLSLCQFARFFCIPNNKQWKENLQFAESISGHVWKNPPLFTNQPRIILARNKRIPPPGIVVDSAPSSYFGYLGVTSSLHRPYFGTVELQLLNNRQLWNFWWQDGCDLKYSFPFHFTQSCS